jgi:hypothetical protein
MNPDPAIAILDALDNHQPPESRSLILRCRCFILVGDASMMNQCNIARIPCIDTRE